MRRNLILSIISVLVMASCEPAGVVLTDAERAECAEQGGAVRTAMSNMQLCVPAFPDAGQMCTNADQCAGTCQALRDGSGGQCMAHPIQDHCGLNSFDSDGVLQSGFCI